MEAISLSQPQTVQIEYLLTQSIQGNHVLFQDHWIRDAFRGPVAKLTSLQIKRTHTHLNDFISLETIEQKMIYIEQLEIKDRNSFIRAYFNMVENNLHEKVSGYH